MCGMVWYGMEWRWSLHFLSLPSLLASPRLAAHSPVSLAISPHRTPTRRGLRLPL